MTVINSYSTNKTQVDNITMGFAIAGEILQKSGAIESIFNAIFQSGSTVAGTYSSSPMQTDNEVDETQPVTEKKTDDEIKKEVV